MGIVIPSSKYSFQNKVRYTFKCFSQCLAQSLHLIKIIIITRYSKSFLDEWIAQSMDQPQIKN